MLFVLVLTVFTNLIIAVAASLIVASFVFTERQTTLTPGADEPWADELTMPDPIRNSFLIKHVDGPLFFGFASQFRDIARQAAAQSRLMVLRMDRIISYMDQTGVYALKDALMGLDAAGVRVLVVGLSVANLDLLKKLQVIPAVISESDVFTEFHSLKKALDGSIEETQRNRMRASPVTNRFPGRKIRQNSGRKRHIPKTAGEQAAAGDRRRDLVERPLAHRGPCAEIYSLRYGSL